jgi:hypothetical protein
LYSPPLKGVNKHSYEALLFGISTPIYDILKRYSSQEGEERSEYFNTLGNQEDAKSLIKLLDVKDLDLFGDQ